MTVLRGFLEGGYIAQSAHGHIERAGDRGGGQREDVHGGMTFLEALLLRHAEALFLVNDGESQIAEFHVFLNEKNSGKLRASAH